MEKSPEIASGHNTSYFRELDARTGRWWSTDPVWQPWQSNYSTFDNNPIALADPSGAKATGGPGKGGGGGEHGECLRYHAQKGKYEAQKAKQAKRAALKEAIGGALKSAAQAVANSDFDESAGRPELAELHKRLYEKSPTFKKLADKANVNKDNIEDNVVYGDFTSTERGTGIIQVNKRYKSYEEAYPGYVHEIHNRASLKKLHEITIKAKYGLITPEEYAIQSLALESEGLAYQIIVLAEAGLKAEGPGSEELNELVEEYNNKNLSKANLFRTTKALMDQLSGENGENLLAMYTGQGEQLKAQGDQINQTLAKRNQSLKVYIKNEIRRQANYRKLLGIK